MLERCSGSAQDAPKSAKGRQGESKIMPRSGLSHPRGTHSVVRTPQDAEHRGFLKLDVLQKGTLRFYRVQATKIRSKVVPKRFQVNHELPKTT